MSKSAEKRTVDMQIIADWIAPQSRVLDLGCGRGVLLEYLQQTKHITPLGVDLDPEKISATLRRNISAYQGDMLDFMRQFPDAHFDNVIISRTLEELSDPDAIIRESLRVSRRVTIGFINHAYWKNRLQMLFLGRKLINPVYTTQWHQTRPNNPAAIADFEHYCRAKNIRITRRAHLRGNWKTPCKFLPNLLAGYALYELTT